MMRLRIDYAFACEGADSALEVRRKHVLVLCQHEGCE